MAPEYLYRGEISAQSDIYSLGLLIIEITTGEQNPREQPSARKFVDKVGGDFTFLFGIEMNVYVVHSVYIS